MVDFVPETIGGGVLIQKEEKEGSISYITTLDVEPTIADDTVIESCSDLFGLATFDELCEDIDTFDR